MEFFLKRSTHSLVTSWLCCYYSRQKTLRALHIRSLFLYVFFLRCFIFFPSPWLRCSLRFSISRRFRPRVTNHDENDDGLRRHVLRPWNNLWIITRIWGNVTRDAREKRFQLRPHRSSRNQSPDPIFFLSFRRATTDYLIKIHYVRGFYMFIHRDIDSKLGLFFPPIRNKDIILYRYIVL